MFIIYFIFVESRRERTITAAKEVEDLRNVLWYAGILLLLVASIGLIAFFNTVSYGAGEMRSRGDDGNIEFSRDNDYILYYINKVKRIKIYFFLLFIVCTCKSEVWLRERAFQIPQDTGHRTDWLSERRDCVFFSYLFNLRSRK